jgi:hypothetical protein
MKAKPRLRCIPTVIWPIADMEEYNARAYNMGACGIFTKPIGAQEAERQIDVILTYFARATRARGAWRRDSGPGSRNALASAPQGSTTSVVPSLHPLKGCCLRQSQGGSDQEPRADC